MILALLLAIVTGGGPQASQTWQAASTTAASITGDVRFAPSRLAFSNGRSLLLRYLGTRPIEAGSQSVHGSATHFFVYQISTKVNPVLLHGNTLCGPAPAFVAFAFSPEGAPAGGTVFANFYSGARSPQTWDSPALCASYTYAIAR